MDKKINNFENYLLYFLGKYITEKKNGIKHNKFEEGEFYILFKVYEYLFLNYEKD